MIRQRQLAPSFLCDASQCKTREHGFAGPRAHPPAQRACSRCALRAEHTRRPGLRPEARTEWSQLPLKSVPGVGHATAATHCVCPASVARASSSSGAAGTAAPPLPALRFFAAMLRDSGAGSAAAAAAASLASSTAAPARRIQTGALQLISRNGVVRAFRKGKGQSRIMIGITTLGSAAPKQFRGRCNLWRRLHLCWQAPHLCARRAAWRPSCRWRTGRPPGWLPGSPPHPCAPGTRPPPPAAPAPHWRPRLPQRPAGVHSGRQALTKRSARCSLQAATHKIQATGLIKPHKPTNGPAHGL